MFKSLCWLLRVCSVSHHWLMDNKPSWLQGDTFKGLLDHPSGTYFSLVLNKLVHQASETNRFFPHWPSSNFTLPLSFESPAICLRPGGRFLWQDAKHSCEGTVKQWPAFSVATEGKGQGSCYFHAKPMPGSREFRVRDRHSWSCWKSS